MLMDHAAKMFMKHALVNLQYVKEVRREANGDSVVILDRGNKVALGRSYRSLLNDQLHHF